MRRINLCFTFITLLTFTGTAAFAQDELSPAEFWTVVEYHQIDQDRKELVFETALVTAQRAAAWLVKGDDTGVYARLGPCLLDRTVDWLDQITGELIEQHPEALLRGENALANAAWMAMMWRCGLLSFSE